MKRLLYTHTVREETVVPIGRLGRRAAGRLKAAAESASASYRASDFEDARNQGLVDSELFCNDLKPACNRRRNSELEFEA